MPAAVQSRAMRSLPGPLTAPSTQMPASSPRHDTEFRPPFQFRTGVTGIAAIIRTYSYISFGVDMPRVMVIAVVLFATLAAWAAKSEIRKSQIDYGGRKRTYYS